MFGFGSLPRTVTESRPPFESAGRQRTRYCCNCQTPEDCKQTKLSACSPCKIAVYCNADCQKEHYTAHKKDCRLVAKSKAISDSDKTLLVDHAQNLFAVCYRSCSDYRKVCWEPCIDAYNYSISQGVRGFQIDDEIALTWLGLEKPEKALRQLVNNIGPPDFRSEMIIEDLTVLDDPKPIPDTYYVRGNWSETDLMVLLAIKVQVIAQLRAGREHYGPDLKSAMSASSLDDTSILKEQERHARNIVDEIGE